MLDVFGFKLSADGASFIVALFCAVIRFFQNLLHGSKTTSKDLVFSVLNGASIVPFCLLGAGVFSQPLLEIAISSKLSMALAGLVGLMFVVGEVLSPESLRVAVAVRSAAPAANDDNTALFAAVNVLQQELTPEEKLALKGAKLSKRIPKDIDRRLLAACSGRGGLGRTLQHSEKAAARKRFLDTA